MKIAVIHNGIRRWGSRDVDTRDCDLLAGVIHAVYAWDLGELNLKRFAEQAAEWLERGDIAIFFSSSIYTLAFVRKFARKWRGVRIMYLGYAGSGDAIVVLPILDEFVCLVHGEK